MRRKLLLFVFFIAMLVTVRSELEIQEETVEKISSDKKKKK